MTINNSIHFNQGTGGGENSFEQLLKMEVEKVTSEVGKEFDLSVLFPASQVELFKSASLLLHDIFEVKSDGSFLVKPADASHALSGHLKTTPLVPGVALKQLFLHQTKNEGKTVNTEFLEAVFPGQTICVGPDGLYNNDNVKKIVSVRVSSEADFKQPNLNKDQVYNPMTENIDDYLLQDGKFRFVSVGAKEAPMADGVHFKGTYHIPQDFQWQEDSIVCPEVIEEIAAQIGSYITGPDLNNNTPFFDAERNLNKNAMIFTFKYSKNQASGASVKLGDAINVEGEVINFDPKSENKEKAKIASLCYIVTNQNGEEISRGEMGGDIIKARGLGVAYQAYQRNQSQKQI